MGRKKIFNYIFPAILLVVVVSISLVAWSFSNIIRASHESETRDKLATAVATMRPLILDELKTTNPNALQSLVRNLSKDSGLRITVINPDGLVLAESTRPAEEMENHANRPEIISAFKGVPKSFIRFSATLQKKLMYMATPLTKQGTPIAVLRVAVTMKSLNRDLKPAYIQIAVIGLLAILAATIMAYIISRKISTPLELLTEASQNYIENAEQSIPLNSEILEIDILSHAMRAMAKSLQNKIEEVIEGKNEIDLILAKMREGVIAIDNDDNITTINPAAEKIFDISFNARSLAIRGRNNENINSNDNPKELTSTFINEVIRSEPLQKFIDELKKTGGFLRKKITIPGLTQQIIDIQGDILREPSGADFGYLLVINDITKITQLEKMRKNFAANVSHELKTPLTVIHGSVETLLDGAKDSPKDAEKFLQTIKKHSERLSALINDIMSLSKIEQADELKAKSKKSIKLCDAVSVACDIVKEKAEKRNVAIKVECPSDITLNADGQMVEQALVNLIDNAVKFSPIKDHVLVTAKSSANFAEITVTDHGPGIQEKHIPFIFERFYRCDKGRSRSEGGTGLGLAIVKHIAQFHNGSVTVQSQPDVATVFTIKLPLVKPAS